ncbi:MAG TPA: metal ABC transporter substrate-binding protein [bacterium]|nr:metal ABC transporter substrate-binding protein [bacterium]
MKVVGSIPDLAALAREVGGDLVETQTIARGDQDPHYLEPKPSFALMLNKADLLIEAGLELESGWLPVLITQSRNPKIQPGQNGFLNAAQELNILEIPTGPVDRSMGDVHPEGNPHYWMNPRNGLVIAKKIAQRLGELDPANASKFTGNYADFEKRLSDRIATWEKEAAPFRGKKVITHHKSFSYFVDWTGLKVEGLIEPKPGIPPNPSHLLSLIQLIQTEKIPLIITENYYDPKPSRELAEKTGAKVLILPTSVGGEPGIRTYEDLFEALIGRLKGAL